MADLVASFEDEERGFESFAHSNGDVHWLASDLASMLGYKSLASFNKAIQKAMATCATLGISIPDNFIQKDEGEYRLSRFACYLTAMNGDVSKPQVAKAQAYFVTLTEAFRRYYLEAEDVERIRIRDEVAGHEKSLNSAASQAGVTNYAYFQDNGYLGLYNMSLNQLKQRKGFSKKSRVLLDFMGKEELAANLFRITQTESKLRRDGVKGQRAAERTALNVGKEVRKAISKVGGTMPEELPLTEDIKKIGSDVKRARRGLEKMDKTALPQRKGDDEK